MFRLRSLLVQHEVEGMGFPLGGLLAHMFELTVLRWLCQGAVVSAGCPRCSLPRSACDMLALQHVLTAACTRRAPLQSSQLSGTLTKQWLGRTRSTPCPTTAYARACTLRKRPAACVAQVLQPDILGVLCGCLQPHTTQGNAPCEPLSRPGHSVQHLELCTAYAPGAQHISPWHLQCTRQGA